VPIEPQLQLENKALQTNILGNVLVSAGIECGFFASHSQSPRNSANIAIYHPHPAYWKTQTGGDLARSGETCPGKHGGRRALMSRAAS